MDPEAELLLSSSSQSSDSIQRNYGTGIAVLVVGVIILIVGLIIGDWGNYVGPIAGGSVMMVGLMDLLYEKYKEENVSLWKKISENN